MVSLAHLKSALNLNRSTEFQCQANLNLYDSPKLDRLATQAVAGRQLRILSLSPEAQGMPEESAQICLCEDDYPGWLSLEDLDLIEEAETPYNAIALSEAEIRARIPQVIDFIDGAKAQSNRYLWGGTVGPNYDCSGLMQTAFASAGIWLPRDAYQQEAFAQPVALDELIPGDLIFFGSPERCTHVGLYLGEGCYIHSSGKDTGRNGIAIDPLSEEGDAIAQAYFRQVRGAGRVVACYQPQSNVPDNLSPQS